MKKVSLFAALASCALLAACQGSVSDVNVDGDADDVMIDTSSSSSVEAMMDESSSSVEAMIDADASASVGVVLDDAESSEAAR